MVATVSSPNGTGDVNGMNNMSAPLIAAVLNNTPTPAPYSEGMESTSFNSIPAGHVLLYNTATKPLVTVVSKAQVNGLPQELGGY